MTQTASHQDYFFTLQNKILFLMGTMPNGLPLWDMLQREAAAKANVETSLATIDQQPHLFIGIEHLPCLLDHATNIKSEIVIVEKSKMLFDFYQKRFHFEDKIPKNFKIILGEIGFYPHHLHNNIKLFNIHHDMMILTLQLFQQKGIHWDQIVLKALTPCPEDEKFYPYFYQSILLILAAKTFHQKNAEIYQKIRLTHKQKTILNLVNTHAHVRELSQQYFPTYLFNDYEKTDIILDDHKLDPGYNTLFSTLLTIPNTDYLNCFKIFEDNATKLLEAIANNPPCFIGLINRSLFINLESMLFLEQMIRELQIPYFSYLVDLISQANTLNWIWNYIYIDKYFSHSNYYILTTNQHLESWYGTENNPARCYYILHQSMQKHSYHAICKAADCELDIAIIQHTLPLFKENTLVNDLFTLIQKNYQGPHLAKALLNYLYQIRNLAKKYHAQFSDIFGILINTIDTGFYHVFRMETIRVNLPTLMKYRTRFFGNNWDKLVPPALQGGLLNDEAAVTQVFQHSKCSIVTSLTINHETPHHTLIKAYLAGCMAIASLPAYDTCGSVLLDPASLVFFANHAALAVQLDYYLNNDQARQNNISTFQKHWEAYLEDIKKSGDIQQRLAQSQIKLDLNQINTTITQSASIDQALCQIAIAYLYHYLGFSHQAAHLIKPILDENKIAGLNQLTYLQQIIQ